MPLKSILLVGLGGMIGSIARYLIGISINNGTFPYATLIVNFVGSFAIGAIAGYALRSASFTDWRLFLATGICGGFTTFSSFSLECFQLLQQSRNIAALSYICISIICGILATIAGYFITR